MFSELVDRIVQESHRGDKRTAIVASLNDVIQRIHAKKNFDRDNREARATLLQGDNVLVWPRPRDFRKMRVAFINGNTDRQPEFMTVNSKFARVDWDYYYYANESFIFCGQGIHHIDIMYLQKPPHFLYYAENERPACWDANANNGQGGWSYLTPDGKARTFAMEPEREALARYRVTDWLLEEYSNVLFWGVLNQLYTLTDDDTQRRSSYALFETGMNDVFRDNLCSALE